VASLRVLSASLHTIAGAIVKYPNRTIGSPPPGVWGHVDVRRTSAGRVCNFAPWVPFRVRRVRAARGPVSTSTSCLGRPIEFVDAIWGMEKAILNCHDRPWEAVPRADGTSEVGSTIEDPRNSSVRSRNGCWLANLLLRAREIEPFRAVGLRKTLSPPALGRPFHLECIA
jgi:hypothetical protein